MRILVVEDEVKVSKLLRQGLEEEEYEVDVASDGLEGESLALSQKHDLIILDLLLPKKDGIAVLRALRAKNINIPVLVLTAKGSTDDKIDGYIAADGGDPIYDDGLLCGAIGISGADQARDADVAIKAIEALGR